MKPFLNFYKEKPIILKLPDRSSGSKVEVYLTNNQIIDEYSLENYFNVNVKGRENFTQYSDKMFEHYLYIEFKNHCRLFSIEGDIFVRFNYL
jgi:hypothetical protein